jgi:hypothetical protein
MTMIDEQELSRRLAETAARVSPPRFTGAELSRRIRRRRAGRGAVVAVTAAAVTATAVAVPVALSGPGLPARPGTAHQSEISTAPPPIPRPGYSIVVNGRAQAFRGNYAITPGEGLTITLDVAVGAHESLSGLWIGITNGLLAFRRDGPAYMSPILAARTTAPLGPGVHQFTMHWVAPRELRAGDTRQLSAEWQWAGPGGFQGGAEGIILVLSVADATGQQ